MNRVLRHLALGAQPKRAARPVSHTHDLGRHECRACRLDPVECAASCGLSTGIYDIPILGALFPYCFYMRFAFLAYKAFTISLSGTSFTAA